MGRYKQPNSNVIVDRTTGDPADVNSDSQLSVESEIVDASGKNYLLTTGSRAPVELYDSNDRNLDLTAQKDVPVTLRDANGRVYELTAQDLAPVALHDANGTELEMESDGSVPNMPYGEYLHEVVKGSFPGKTSLFKFGRSDTISTTEQVIWDGGGGAAYEFPTVLETITIVSNSANDVAAGTGARTMIVYGLDDNYDEVSDVITLTGTTPVVTTQTYRRVHRAFVLTAGTNSILGGANDGTITITHTTSTQVLAQIKPNNGQTLMGIYTIPAGKTFFITGLSLSVGQGKDCTFYVRTRNGITSADSFSVKYSSEMYEAAFTTALTTPFRISEKSDMCITAITSAGSIEASVSWGGILIDN